MIQNMIQRVWLKEFDSKRFDPKCSFRWFMKTFHWKAIRFQTIKFITQMGWSQSHFSDEIGVTRRVAICNSIGVSLDSIRLHWVSLGLIAFQWVSLDFFRLHRVLLDFPWASVDFIRLSLVFVGLDYLFPGPSWTSLDFIRLHWIELQILGTCVRHIARGQFSGWQRSAEIIFL